jgi:hypothetical protein
MPTLNSLLSAMDLTLSLSTPAEIHDACRIIVDVQSKMENGEHDCLIAAYESGPLFDGDVPCKASRDNLMALGYMARVVVKGEEGQNACTQSGALAYHVLMCLRQ